MEKNNLLAKYEVETLEAESRMFRKKLTFKTTPMSIFYQEPPPHEEDISNKSQSPKLGHRKSLLPAVSEANRNINGRSSRFSLDEKVPQTLLEGLLLCIQRSHNGSLSLDS
ncbi:hypothetical protein TB2_043039 [Malus domestica]